ALRATQIARTLKEKYAFGRTLVAGQVAVSLLLLIGAGLFVRTLRNLESVETGFAHHNLLLFALDPPHGAYPRERIAALYNRVLDGLQSMPGADSVTASSLALLSGWRNNSGIITDGPKLNPGQSSNIFWNTVGPRFFETVGIPILLGRGIERGDIEGSKNVMVI